MTPTPAHINNWSQRIRALGELLRQLREPGNLALILVIVGLAIFTGYIPSPLTAMAIDLKEHRQDQRERDKERKEFTEALKRLNDTLIKQEQRQKVRDCAEIKDPELRRECLK